MLPEKVTTHEAEAKALLISQFRGRQVIEGLLSSWIAPLQELENVLWDVIDKRVLETAVDAQLDSLGKLVGELRLGRANDAFRAAIKVRIKVNRSKGRSEDVLQVAKLLDATATYLEFTKLEWLVEIYETAYCGDFVRLLTQTKAATSYGVLNTSTWIAGDECRYVNEGDPTLGNEYDTGANTKRYVCSLATNPAWLTVPMFEPLLDENGDYLFDEDGFFIRGG